MDKNIANAYSKDDVKQLKRLNDTLATLDKELAAAEAALEASIAAM